MNSIIPVCDYDLPHNWISNAHNRHGEQLYTYNRQGRIEYVDAPCACVMCLRRQHPEFVAGPPVQVHPEYTPEVLTENGYVGLYDSTKEPPPEEVVEQAQL